MEIKKYRIKNITPDVERDFVKKWHYSHKVVPNSCIRLGCYYDYKLIEAISFGRIINCIKIFGNARNREGLELNRLSMVDEAPKNSESWFLMRSISILKKGYPWLKFIHTWADGLRCQGGTIYKACGFSYLRKIKIGSQYKLPNGSVIHSIAFNKTYLKKYYNKLKGITGEINRIKCVFGESSSEVKGGYNYHYVYRIDKDLEFLLKPKPYEKVVHQ